MKLTWKPPPRGLILRAHVSLQAAKREEQSPILPSGKAQDLQPPAAWPDIPSAAMVALTS